MRRDMEAQALADLDALFAEARATEPQPGPGLPDRICGDADQELARRAARRSVLDPRRGRAGGRPIAARRDTRPAWRVVTGLAACAVAGFCFGFAGPDSVTGLPGLEQLTGAALAHSVEDGVGILLADDTGAEG